jgi:hypothetical protein
VKKRFSSPAAAELGRYAAVNARLIKGRLRPCRDAVGGAGTVRGVPNQGLWGKVIDTAGDCSVKGDENRLTIEVPGGTHGLSPSHRRLHAPRVLNEVEGDFLVQVKATGDFRPGEESTPPSPQFLQRGRAADLAGFDKLYSTRAQCLVAIPLRPGW